MASVREALEKISELESRKAILETLRAYLETHYRSSDAGEASMTITRDDVGVVPEEHINAQIGRITVDIEAVTQELDGWKGLTILPPEEEVDDEAIVKKVKRGRRKRGTQSQRRNQSSTRASKPGGAGQAA